MLHIESAAYRLAAPLRLPLLLPCLCSWTSACLHDLLCLLAYLAGVSQCQLGSVHSICPSLLHVCLLCAARALTLCYDKYRRVGCQQYREVPALQLGIQSNLYIPSKTPVIIHALAVSRSSCIDCCVDRSCFMRVWVKMECQRGRHLSCCHDLVAWFVFVTFY